MSKKNKETEEIQEEMDSQEENQVQNAPIQRQWASFDMFWASCVKNGTPLIKESFKMHLKSMGWLNKPENYIEGAIHFGIAIEKDKR